MLEIVIDFVIEISMEQTRLFQYTVSLHRSLDDFCD